MRPVPAFLRGTLPALCLFLLPALLTAQVNTEALRQEDLSPGLHSSAGLNLGYIAGNSSLVQLRSNLRLDYRKDANHFFLVAQYQQGRKDAARFINKGFVHLRAVKTLRPALQVEGFLQREFNEFILLKDRQLVGAGARIRWRPPGSPPQRPNSLRLITGLGLMWEREQIDTSGLSTGEEPATSIIRSTNYVVLQWRPDERLTFSSTAYVQFHLRRFADLRILWEGGLRVTLTRRLALTVNVNLRYDHEPPGDIKPYDIDLTNGLTYTF